MYTWSTASDGNLALHVWMASNFGLSSALAATTSTKSMFWMCDTWSALGFLQIVCLRTANIRLAQIQACKRCTHQERAEFFSYKYAAEPALRVAFTTAKLHKLACARRPLHSSPREQSHNVANWKCESVENSCSKHGSVVPVNYIYNVWKTSEKVCGVGEKELRNRFGSFSCTLRENLMNVFFFWTKLQTTYLANTRRLSKCITFFEKEHKNTWVNITVASHLFWSCHLRTWCFFRQSKLQGLSSVKETPKTQKYTVQHLHWKKLQKRSGLWGHFLASKRNTKNTVVKWNACAVEDIH